MPEYRFGTGNTHIRAKLKNFDWSLDKDRSKLWDTKYGGLAPQVLLKPGWRGNFFHRWERWWGSGAEASSGEILIGLRPRLLWEGIRRELFWDPKLKHKPRTQGALCWRKGRITEEARYEELFRDDFIPDSFFCSPQSKFQEAPWRLTFRKYCKTR